MPTNTNSHSVVKWFAVVLILAAAGVAAWQYRQRQAEPKPLPPTAQTYNAPNQRPPQNNNTTTNTSQTPTQLPPSLLISIPFTSQAPTANWDELHNDACEEASVIMAYAYFNNIKSLPPEVVETEITKLTEWQDKNYGYHLSIDTTEAARMIEEVYNLNTEIVTYSETTVKRALAENKLVIWPGNGRMLGNPNFRAPGPLYHMFVITGYNEQGFITHDPGTRKGKDYQYSYETIRNATGNYLHDRHDVDLNDKRIIIVSQ